MDWGEHDDSEEDESEVESGNGSDDDEEVNEADRTSEIAREDEMSKDGLSFTREPSEIGEEDGDEEGATHLLLGLAPETRQTTSSVVDLLQQPDREDEEDVEDITPSSHRTASSVRDINDDELIEP